MPFKLRAHLYPSPPGVPPNVDNPTLNPSLRDGEPDKGGILPSKQAVKPYGPLSSLQQLSAPDFPPVPGGSYWERALPLPS